MARAKESAVPEGLTLLTGDGDPLKRYVWARASDVERYALVGVAPDPTALATYLPETCVWSLDQVADRVDWFAHCHPTARSRVLMLLDRTPLTGPFRATLVAWLQQGVRVVAAPSNTQEAERFTAEMGVSTTIQWDHVPDYLAAPAFFQAGSPGVWRIQRVLEPHLAARRS